MRFYLFKFNHVPRFLSPIYPSKFRFYVIEIVCRFSLSLSKFVLDQSAHPESSVSDPMNLELLLSRSQCPASVASGSTRPLVVYAESRGTEIGHIGYQQPEIVCIESPSSMNVHIAILRPVICSNVSRNPLIARFKFSTLVDTIQKPFKNNFISLRISTTSLS